MHGSSPLRRALSASAALAVAVTTVSLGLGVSSASADTTAGATASTSVGPVVDRTAKTVTSAPLPTAQINGIVWSQATIGNTVYVGGQFTKARPAGSAVGSNETVRNNALSYDITTGNLNTGFDPNVNGQIKAVAVSPDKSRVYIGGDFTTAGGVTENRIAAVDPSTGAVISSFNAGTNATVNAIVATNSTVYVGGYFSNANGVGRTRLAAFSAATGALTSWAPTADDDIDAIALTPDNSKVIIGGKFQNVSGSAQQGVTALDASTGALLPWAANQTVKLGNTQSGVFSLNVDNDTVYGSSFNYGTGNFEGIFAMRPTDGSLVWLGDCHGDTYASYSMNDVVYSAGHAHNCSNISGFPENTPRWAWRSMAFTKAATQTVQPNSQFGDGYGNFAGQPAPSTVYWFPQFTIGTITNQDQAVWSMTGNGTYLSAGGEFPSINGKAQQGLVRFALPTVASTKTSGPTQLGGVTNPTVTALGNNAVRVNWKANWDRDDRFLTYKLYRSDKSSTPLDTRTVQSTFWQLPAQGFTDSSVQPGQTYRYRIVVSDPDGNGTMSDYVSVTVPTTGSFSAYAQAVVNDGATSFYRLDDAQNSTLADLLGANNLSTGSNLSPNTDGAITGDSDGSANLNYASGTVQTKSSVAPNTFTAETWMRTTSTAGGKILGFGDSANGNNSTSYDRQVYLDDAGHLTFGVYPGAVRSMTSADTFNDGQWHHVVAELSPAGMALFVDGIQQGFDAGTTTGQSYTGYWHLGYDNLSGWPNAGDTTNFKGDLDETAFYPTALTVAQIRDHYTKSGRSVDIQSQPADSYGAGVYNDNPTLYWRLNDTSGPSIKDAGVNRQPGVAAGGVTYGAASPVSGSTGTAVGFNGSDATIASVKAAAAPSVYSEELWFNTTTTSGGKLIGYGDQQSGYSGNYDRHVYMENSGQLTFGTWTGQTNLATSPASYNDGKWHQMVATQGSDGMKLYLDGVLVATNAQTQAQGYNGYWRVGGDSDWGGDSAFFKGSIDEVAVYPNVLTPTQVKNHYAASSAATNAAPTASFTSSCQSGSCAFDGSASSDSDGTIASYAWDFGDNSTGTGAGINHRYAASGTYTVTLTVTDNGGAKSTATKTVTVAVDVPPTAAFSTNCTALDCVFDGSTSTDSDGTIASYAWDFGDNTSGTGANPRHSYAAAGTYAVVLTVADNGNATNSVTKSVTVTAPPKQNVAPTASFTSTAADLKASFDGSTSTDSDGTVASYGWDFGDTGANSTGTGKTTTHTYAAAGTYTVKLTVTDDQGATNSVTKSVTVTAPPKQNVAPTASFTSSAADLKASFDGSASTDSDGTVASYGWDFGDTGANSTGTGKTTTHTYAAAGTYTVKLTVTDDQGAANSVTKSVTVTAPASSSTVAADTFSRNTSSGWGAAETGGNWVLSGGNANFATADGVGTMKLGTNSTLTAALDSATAGDTVVTLDSSLDKVPNGSGVVVKLLARKSGNTFYALKVIYRADGTLHLAEGYTINNTETVIKEVAVSNLTYAPGTKLRAKFTVTGNSPATLTGKIWAVGTTEPAANQISVTTSGSGVGATGGVGIRAGATSNVTTVPVTLSLDNFAAIKP